MSSFLPDDLRARLAALGCDPTQVEESFVHSGGAGGQNVNKVATCVQLRYAARNVSIKMQEHRTQAANRIAAWRLLASQLSGLREREQQERQAARERKRRQNAKRPAGVKRQFVESKRRRAKVKQGRGKFGAEE